MRFDSHLLVLIEAAVNLTNALTPGDQGGQAYQPPVAEDRNRRIAGILTSPAGPTPHITDADSAALTEVADRLRLIFTAAAHGEPGEAATIVNALMVESGARPQLDPDATTGWQMHFHGADDSVVLGWTAGLATALALAIGSELTGRLGVCAAERCDRVYVDGSRNAGRKFCSAACQNRTKAAAFRARDRQPR